MSGGERPGDAGTPGHGESETRGRVRAGLWVAVTFAAVFVAQMVLVAVAGTDIPFHDQWNIEGQWLYPQWVDGTLRPAELLQPFNEHRIVWTHLLNLGLFAVNGQWDPLVQLWMIAVLRAACAAGLVWLVVPTLEGRGRAVAAGLVTLGFLPVIAWHNVLWGIESHAYFSLGFSLGALALLGREEWSWRRVMAGVVVVVAGLFAMGPSALVPVALLGMAAVRAVERRRIDRKIAAQAGLAAGLLVLALSLRAEVPEHATLKAAGAGEFLAAAARTLSWPHVNVPWASVALNLPILVVVGGRMLRRRKAVGGEDFVLLVGGWSAAISLATAWARGGSTELLAGVPSRYVDFVVLLPLANVWCAVVLVREEVERSRATVRLVAGAWALFVLVGWIGLNAEVMRGLVLPRARDREAPVRLAVVFQRSGDPAVYAAQPRILVPSPNLELVSAVLKDPRLQGKLPPSLQPERPTGPLSRAARWLLGR